MNCYETLLVVKPTLSDEEIQAQISKTEEVIKKESGDILVRDDMGMRRLAYPIQKQERGYYSIIYYKAPATAIAEIERQLRYNEEILRFMTVRYTNKKEIAQFEKMVENAKRRSGATSEKAESETSNSAE